MVGLLLQTCTLILKLGCSLVAGFIAVRFGFVTEKQGLAFITGRLGLPLLAFKAIVTADLGRIRTGVILSCTLGKCCVYLLACFASWIAYRKQGHSECLISAGIFSFHVTAANDFVFGMPIVESFFPDGGLTNLAANVVVQNVVFQACSLCVLGIGKARQQMSGDPGDIAAGSNHHSSFRCWGVVKKLMQDPLLCAICFAVIYKTCLCIALPQRPASQALPWVLGEIVDFFTQPFCMCALFLTGANLASAFDVDADANSNYGPTYFVVTPVALVTAKNIICPFATLAFAQLILPGTSGTQWHNFAFLYGLIPTSSAPMLVAMRTGRHVEVVAAAVSMGIVVAVPMLIACAVLFGKDAQENMEANLFNAEVYAVCLSLPACLLCLAFWKLADPRGAWPKFPRAMLALKCVADFMYDLTTLIGISSKCRYDTLDRLLIFFQMEGRVLAAIMLLERLLHFKAVRMNVHVLLAVCCLPIPLCLWAPTESSGMMGCHLGVGKASTFHLVMAAIAFLAFATLWVVVLCIPEKPAQLGDVPTDSHPQDIRQPEKAPLRTSQSSNALIEFEPDSPRKFKISRHRRSNISGSTFRPLVADRPVVLQLPPALNRHQPHSNTNAHIQLLEQVESRDSNLLGTCPHQDDDRHVSLAVLVIGAKTTVLCFMSMSVRFVLSFQEHLEPSSLLAILMARLLQESGGILLLLLLVILFDTPCSWLVNTLKARRRAYLDARNTPTVTAC
eukprot:TRINITY_DN104666_c0_g1_i1.p1 TRINITY_DN104666_c0_g1~~TRINITY_DN104666_c0_g1_i1.p1  ORF type:complete len:732 (-),score=47.78 TRINITY_DN104666_c0_g1_i1:359-2554(-)